MTSNVEYIDLNRAFADYDDHDERETASQELWYLELMEAIDNDNRLHWCDLHTSMRLIVLGDAGAGKTAELQHQAAKLHGCGETAFYMTVDKLARVGLRKATYRKGEDRLSLWRQRNDQAHFFIDSVDQARLNGRSLDDALDEIQQVLNDAELGRARIILSCRYTDWRVIRDRQSVSRLLSPSTNDTLKSSDRYKPRTVVLLPLDRKQMRSFTLQHRLDRHDEFLCKIRETGTEILARRPGDLLILMRYWEDKKKIGNLTELLSHTAERFLGEENAPERHISLDIETIRRTVYLLAGALTVTRTEEIGNPADDLQHPVGTWLSPKKYLHDLRESQILEVLALRFFDPATFGRVRFHHRSLQEFCLARWLDSLCRAGLSNNALNDLLFERIRGQLILRPQFKAAAAWLAQEHEEIRESILDAAPQTLITDADPAGLPLPTRIQALRAYVSRYSDREILRDSFDVVKLRNFAEPGMCETIEDLLRDDLPDDHIILLVRIVQYGQIRSCREIVLHLATTSAHKTDVCEQAIAAVGAVGLPDDKSAVVMHYLESTSLSLDIFRALVEEFYPTHLAFDDLLMLLKMPRAFQTPHSTSGEHWISQIICERTPATSRARLIQKFRDIVIQASSEYGADGHKEFIYSIYWQMVAVHATQWKLGDDLSFLMLPLNDTTRTLRQRFGHHSWRDPLETALGGNVELRRILFEQIATETEEQMSSWPLFQVWTPNPLDTEWLLNTARSAPVLRIRRSAMLVLLQYRGLLNADRDAIAQSVSDEPSLAAECAEILRHHKDSDTKHASWEQKQAELRAQQQADLTEDIQQNLQSIRTGEDLPRLLSLYLAAIQDDHGPLRSLLGLRKLFRDEVVAAAQLGTRVAWRLHTALAEYGSSTLEFEFGLTSISLDLKSDSDIQLLGDDLARRATKIGIRDPHGLPEWFERIAHVYPGVVREIIDHVFRNRTKVPRRDELLRRLLRGPVTVCELAVASSWSLLEDHTQKLSTEEVGSILSILRRCKHKLDRVKGLSKRACMKATQPDDYAIWWGTWFRLDSSSAILDLASRIEKHADDGREYLLTAAAQVPNNSPAPPSAEATTLKQLWLMITDCIPETPERPRPGSTMEKVAFTRNWIINEIARANFPGGYDALLELADLYPRYRDWLRARAEQRLHDEALEAPNPIADSVLEKYRMHGTSALDRLVDQEPATNSASSLVPVTDERLIEALATVIWDHERAREIARAAGFAPANIPVMQVPRVFWSRLVEDARNGAIRGRVQAVADAAAHMFTENTTFRCYRGIVERSAH